MADVEDDCGLVAVCRLEELPEGEALRVELADRSPIAVFHTEGMVYAIDDACTHAGASLAEGWLEGSEIGCPVHRGRFCLKTGAALCFPAIAPVKTYPVQLRDGVIHIALGAPPAA
jgi:3-phenylpropionate/trans-cinnamate dioxygenase ferredoxin subunit